jgi:hypothetical protein
MFYDSLASDLELTRREIAIYRRLATPEKIQAYLTAFPINHEVQGETCYSARRAIRERVAHCQEAGFIAAAAMMLHGFPALVMHLKADGVDDDHVVVLFRRGTCWGAVSKSNTASLRWRDPVYRSLRELAMSYFHEYALGPRKTLRSYSRPFDMSKVDPALWLTNREHCWEVAELMRATPHYGLLTSAQVRRLRPRDRHEMRLSRIHEYPLTDASASTS